jgi:hypothetical protein
MGREKKAAKRRANAVRRAEKELAKLLDSPARRAGEQALTAVQDWVDRAATEPLAILAADAERDRAALAAISVPEDEIVAGYWLAMFHWLRHKAAPSVTDRHDLKAALELFAWVYRNNPDNVPSVLHHWYAPDGQDAEAIDSSHEDGGPPMSAIDELFIRRAILAAARSDHPRYAEFVSDLGKAVVSAFEGAGPGSRSDQLPL